MCWERDHQIHGFPSSAGLTALLFVGSPVTLLNHNPHIYFLLIFTHNIPPYTPYTPSPTDFYPWKGTHVFSDPFPNTRQATKVPLLEKLLISYFLTLQRSTLQGPLLGGTSDWQML